MHLPRDNLGLVSVICVRSKSARSDFLLETGSSCHYATKWGGAKGIGKKLPRSDKKRSPKSDKETEEGSETVTESKNEQSTPFVAR